MRSNDAATSVPRRGAVVADAGSLPGVLHADLLTEGLAVRDGFLSPPRVLGLHECAARRRVRGDFSPARVGAESRLQTRREIRGDSSCWLAEPRFAEERALLDDLERLRLEFNREGYLGLFDLELHYARYPSGAGYARHLDQPLGRDQRRVSVILYLNPEWPAAAGGELRVFDGAQGHRDIEPIGGRLVCFLTAGREHEVLPARRDRLSVSGWFRSRER